jgi:eukaryotic-like serine/threonine-protein kinase
VRRIRANGIWLLLLIVLVAAAIEIVRSRSKPDAERVVVPTVVDLTEAEAQRRLSAEELTWVVVRRASAGPGGRVLNQDPNGGSRVVAARQVLLVVSASQPIVPRLIGLSLPLAAKRLQSADLVLRFRAVTSNRRAGVVVATRPAPGESVTPGATVTVSVSSGPGRVSVPDLLWIRVAEARASVHRTGLVARMFDVPSNEPAGTVVAQSPQPGAELSRGSIVRLDVSTGAADPETPALPRNVDVPSLVGRTLGAAQDELEARGLVVRVEYLAADAPLGEVLRQEPDATTTRRGANVSIAVSAGPDQSDLLEVILLVGLLEDGATSAIETAGFVPRVRRERTPDPAEVGVVVRQEPEAYRQAPQGGPITIYVGAGGE